MSHVSRYCTVYIQSFKLQKWGKPTVFTPKYYGALDCLVNWKIKLRFFMNQLSRIYTFNRNIIVFINIALTPNVLYMSHLMQPWDIMGHGTDDESEKSRFFFFYLERFGDYKDIMVILSFGTALLPSINKIYLYNLRICQIGFHHACN